MEWFPPPQVATRKKRKAVRIQKDVKSMTDALTSYFEDGPDREVAQEAAYHLAEIKEVADRYLEAFRRLASARAGHMPSAEAARLLAELQALVFEQGIVHAKGLRQSVEELRGMFEEDGDSNTEAGG